MFKNPLANATSFMNTNMHILICEVAYMLIYLLTQLYANMIKVICKVNLHKQTDEKPIRSL